MMNTIQRFIDWFLGWPRVDVNKEKCVDTKYKCDENAHAKFWDNFGHSIKHSGVETNHGAFKLVMNELIDRVKALEEQVNSFKR